MRFMRHKIEQKEQAKFYHAELNERATAVAAASTVGAVAELRRRTAARQSGAKGARTERAGRTAPLPSSATLATGIATVPKSVGVSSANGADSPDKLADL